MEGTWVSKMNGRRKNRLGQGKKNNGPCNSSPGIKEWERKGKGKAIGPCKSSPGGEK